ncbi:zinc finger and BTB domain-containing protein 1 [Discoglossus pictus]
MERSRHCSYVLQQLYNQREWGFLCDCCIAIDDIYFQTHKAVLAACSSYFKMIFINHQNTLAQLNLSSTKISPECFDLILQFMYLGKVLTAPPDFQQLKRAMNYLQMYIIPECLEDIQDVYPSSYMCSSTASSSTKMVFGVRMYDEPVEKGGGGGGEPSRWTSEPTLSINSPQERKDDGVQFRFQKQTIDVYKKNPVPKMSTTRDRTSRRFGRSYTCDGCGFVFSNVNFLDEHIKTCTNRPPFQNKVSYSGDTNDSESSNPKPSSFQDNVCKVESSQSTEDSLSPGSTKNSLVGMGRTKNEMVDTTDKEPVIIKTESSIIKIESEDNSLVEMDDINIVKISDKDYFESSDIEDLEDEPEETMSSYYGEEPCNSNVIDGKFLKKQFAQHTDGNGVQYLGKDRNESVQDTVAIICELCGVTITEVDLSSHYLSKHIESICACGKCGQILVKGRQLQEHAERCGEPQEQMEHYQKNDQETLHFGEGMEEHSNVGDVLGMWDDLSETNLQKNDDKDKQIGKNSTCSFRCPNCGQHFESENLVVEHMSHCLEHEIYRHPISDENDRDHRRKHFCSICGKGFYQRCHLREHYTVHTKEKQFVCQTCGKQFLRERQLRLHNDMHTGMARYICSLCDQGNFRKHDHVRHMISHLAAGETICQICFQIFPSNDLLEQHMDVHLYTCGVCGAKFNLRKDMRSHYNSKHFKKS